MPVLDYVPHSGICRSIMRHSAHDEYIVQTLKWFGYQARTEKLERDSPAQGRTKIQESCCTGATETSAVGISRSRQIRAALDIEPSSRMDAHVPRRRAWKQYNLGTISFRAAIAEIDEVVGILTEAVYS